MHPTHMIDVLSRKTDLLLRDQTDVPVAFRRGGERCRGESESQWRSRAFVRKGEEARMMRQFNAFAQRQLMDIGLGERYSFIVTCQ